MKFYNFFLKYMLIYLSYNNIYANLFSLVDRSQYTSEFTPILKTQLLANVVVLQVNFTGLTSTKTCLGSIVNPSIGQQTKNLVIFTASFCLKSKNNIISLKNIKSISITNAIKNPNSSNETREPQTITYIFNDSTKLLINDSNSGINDLQNNNKFNVNDNVVYFRIQANSISIPRAVAVSSGLPIESYDSNSKSYYLPQFVKDTNSKLLVLPIPITRGLSELIEEDDDAAADYILLNNDYSINEINANKKTSYIEYQQPVIDNKLYKFDDFIIKDIGAPLLKCNLSNDQVNQTCSVVAINTGVRVKKGEKLPTVFMQSFVINENN